MGNALSYRRDFGLIVVGAILFTASFLWKDLITEIEEVYFPKINGMGGRIVFTILVTIILVIIAVEMKDFFGISTNKKKIDDQKNNQKNVKLVDDGVSTNELANDSTSTDELVDLDMAAMGIALH